MQTVKTIPGRTYAVECAGEVIVTNTETGAIATQGDGTGQVWFTACANSYDVSDDTAKVFALFKLAPRLKLTLLQGVAGGWLPKGFTELEYLESSGTQYIELPDVFRISQEYNPKSGIKIRSKDYKLVNNNYIFNIDVEVYGSNRQFFYMGMRNTTYEALGMGINGYNHFPSGTYRAGEIFTGTVNFLGSNKSSWNTDERGNLWSGITRVISNSTTLMKNATCKLIDCVLSYGTEVTRELIPVLDENGTPCMFDKISSTCFRNQGTGTFGYRIKRTGETTAPMSLRDPYYTAPSGVYARHSGENELEVLADTEEVSGDGWVWFANTGEAYEHFGIVQEDELLTE